MRTSQRGYAVERSTTGIRPEKRNLTARLNRGHANLWRRRAGTPGERHEEPGGAFRALRESGVQPQGRVLADRFHHVLKRTPTEVRRALAYVLLNARKHYRQRRRRTPPVVLDGASSGLWFDGWKGRGPPPGRYADTGRPPEVAAPRTWLLSKGWRRIGLVDPAEVPGR